MVGELAVGLFHDVGLGDDGRRASCRCLRAIFEGGAGDAARAGVGDDLEVHGQAGKFDAAAAEGVFALGVLAEERPVHALFGDAHGAHVGVEVEGAAQRDVGALQRAALGGGGGAFEEDVAALDGRKHFGGHGLAARQAVFDGQAVDGAQFQRAARRSRPRAGLPSTRAASFTMMGPMPSPPTTPTTVSGFAALSCAEALSMRSTRRELFFQKGAEVLHGPFDLCVHCLPSLV